MNAQDIVDAFGVLASLVAKALKAAGWASPNIVSTLGGVAKRAAQEVCYGPHDPTVD